MPNKKTGLGGGSSRLIDVRYPPPADEGAVAPRIPSAGAGTTARSRRESRPGGSVALGVVRAASWGAEEPTASCPPALGPETRLLWTALRQEEKGGGHAPERWKDCIPIGQHMPGTRFIAVKSSFEKENFDHIRMFTRETIFLLLVPQEGTVLRGVTLGM
ncbi:Rna/Rnp Complex-1-Interacting Phosphatase [Manis pentadactyla]|nr:Rna/Rnp Complex-1-Interacting Phosphatase [Manis pentadactyla]